MIRTRSHFYAHHMGACSGDFGGCATDPLSNIPSNATIASSGNDHLSYTAAVVWQDLGVRRHQRPHRLFRSAANK